MTFEHATELLPWLLNGTLAAAERDEVWNHLETCERCRRDLAETREAWSVFAQHLPSQNLVALAWGETPSAAVEEHLESCARCAAELELARMSRRLEEDDRIAVFPGVSVKPAAREGSRSWRAAALAASLAGVVAAAGWISEFRQSDSLAEQLAQRPAPVSREDDSSLRAKMGRLQDQVQDSQKTQEDLAKRLDQATSQYAELEQKADSLLKPQINPWSEIVGPREVERGGQAAPMEEEQVFSAGRPAVPRLGAESPNAVREIEILNSRRKVLWSESGLRSTQDQEYKLIIPPGFLKPGRYTVQLYSRENGKRVPRETYRIRVE